MRILLADDNRAERFRLDTLLRRWGYDPVLAEDGAAAWRILEEEAAPRLAILDWVMPVMDGLQICRLLRKRPERPYVYVVVLTSRGGRQETVDGLEAGADDFLAKPFDTGELRARLNAGKRIVTLQDELIGARESLRFQATHDSLTGLWNRRAIAEILKRELARGKRQKIPVSVAMADLDHFKQVNDSFGHLTGDAVLRETARTMQSVLRVYDSAGRFGGEEFLIILPGSGIEAAMVQAQRMLAEVGALDVKTPDGTCRNTLSLGVSATDQAEGLDESALLQAADLALYRAKEEGRNRAIAATLEDFRLDRVAI